MPFKNPHPLYTIWRGMRNRCLNINYVQYKDYGGRGIKICERWKSFEVFCADMGPRPSPNHSLDRKNNSGNYEPSNCKWSTKQEQQRNRRVMPTVVIERKVYLLRDLVELSGLKHSVIRDRIERGLSYEEVMRKDRYWATPNLGKKSIPKTHCPSGHAMTEENTLLSNRKKPSGYAYVARVCKTCHNARVRRNYWENNISR